VPLKKIHSIYRIVSQYQIFPYRIQQIFSFSSGNLNVHLNKGNNKITELRTILQREGQKCLIVFHGCILLHSLPTESRQNISDQVDMHTSIDTS
jgi:hypothetical protein